MDLVVAVRMTKVPATPKLSHLAVGQRLRFIFAALLPAVPLMGAAGGASEIFLGGPAGYTVRIDQDEPATEASWLRTISVEERVGVERRGELVRVPVFFAAGECASVDELAIVPAEKSAGREIVVQADDIRHGPDGGISRVHLWFAVDLAAGAKRQFHLVKRTPSSSAVATPVGKSMTTSRGGEIRFETDSGEIVWNRRGALRSLSSGGATWTFEDEGAFPRVRIAFPARDEKPAIEVVFDQSTDAPEVAWAAGPLFAKLRIRLKGPEGTALEQEYRVPRHGREVIVSTAIFPGARAGGVVKENQILVGDLASGKRGVELLRVPAGIRYDLRAEHSYVVNAVTRARENSSLLSVPLVIGGTNGRLDLDDETLVVRGQGNLQRGNEGEKDSLRGFWTETRLVPTKAVTLDELWKVYRDHVQPLVAIVEEPGVTTEHLHAALSDIAREMKPIGWRQEAGRAAVMDNPDRMKKILAQKQIAQEAEVERLVIGANNTRAKMTNNGQRKLREDEKGRAYGRLDPYHITYTQSAAAALDVLYDAPEQVGAVNLAMARGVRRVGGKADSAGNPYIDCFARALNMQMGAVLFGLTAGVEAGDTELAQFYRDLATSLPVLGIFGRGQRPYSGAPAKSGDSTDYLYQSICDFWLRTAELLGHENLQLHPLAYGRYTDCVDVMADRFHGEWAKDKSAESEPRANFFRGQAHTHRWLGWSAAPFIRLLQDPTEQATVGLTEAVHYARARKGHWKNWPDLTFYLLADLLVRDGLSRYQRPDLPARPAKVEVTRRGGRAELSWSAVEGAAGYRVYRAKNPGGPYDWLNSPYREKPGASISSTRFVDDEADANAVYVVMAVDAAGRQSPWREAPPSE